LNRVAEREMQWADRYAANLQHATEVEIVTKFFGHLRIANPTDRIV
jgi:hypothetical protein